MSQVWVPWRERPERFQLRGLKFFAWAPILMVYGAFKRFPAVMFYGGGVALCLVIWMHAELFDFMETKFLQDAAVNNPAELSFFGGTLSLAETQAGVALHIGPSWEWLAYALYPVGHELVRDLLAMTGVFILISLIPLFTIWWERKVSAHIQSRIGPMRVGGWHGWTQTLADGVKLVAKEDFIPKDGDRPMFRLAPYLTFVPTIVAFAALPFGSYWIFRNTDVGLLFILAMLGIEVVGVILAGWSSNNKWSMLGAMREACQMVSYEIPMGMALLLPVMIAGTLNLNTMGQQQAGGWFTWFCFTNPFMFAAALAYYIASLASCKRAPFDLAESESELVAGFHTEYSGFRWSMFFFAEYCAMFVGGGLATILFFGAWYSPISEAWLSAHLSGVWKVQEGIGKTFIMGILGSGPLWFILKCALFVYIQLWLRWTLPRIRIDQVLYACVQVLLPMMMILLLGNTAWILLVPEGSMLASSVSYVLGGVGGLIILSFVVVAIRGFVKRRQLVGYLAIDSLPGA